MKVIVDEVKIDEILSRGVHEVFTKEDLKNKLMSGKQLHIKLGTDVTGAFLHLGHSVLHRKVRDFQELGHKVTLIVGDFTTLVGDHSDKVDMRADITEEQIKKNQKGWEKQFYKTIIKESSKIRNNSEWLKKLTFKDVLNLTKQFTVSQMLDRETFLLRYNSGKPIGLDEFLYPLMQGYDSVAIKCDVEIGATDQTFNLLAGRRLMESFSMKPQSALIMKLLVGSDGRPMGKSLQNFIAIGEDPNEMYGKIMSIVDSVIFEYFELVTRVPMNKIEEMKKDVLNGTNPMIYKKILAREIVSFYHGEKAAEKAESNFENTFSKGEIPEDIKKVTVKIKMPLVDILIKNGMVSSKSEFRRLVEEGAIKFFVNTEERKIIDPQTLVEGDGAIKIGKKRFIHITVQKK